MRKSTVNKLEKYLNQIVNVVNDECETVGEKRAFIDCYFKGYFKINELMNEREALMTAFRNELCIMAGVKKK